MQHVAKGRGLDIIVDSAGTAGYHVGEWPDERSVRSLVSYAPPVDLRRDRSVQVGRDM